MAVVVSISCCIPSDLNREVLQNGLWIAVTGLITNAVLPVLPELSQLRPTIQLRTVTDTSGFPPK